MKDAILSTEEKIVEKEKKVDIPQELTSISHSYETFRDWSRKAGSATLCHLLPQDETGYCSDY